jgi:ankyrin repeat protein
MLYNVEDIANQRNCLFNDKVALHWATHLDSVDTAILLVNHGASLDIPDLDGHTPLHYAAERGSINVLKLLIQHGGCTTLRSSNPGMTPLLYACWNGFVEVTASLLSFEQGFVEDIFDQDAVHLSMLVGGKLSQVKLCAMLSPRRFDLHGENVYGLCAIYRVILCSKHWVLRYILREYSLFLRIRGI